MEHSKGKDPLNPSTYLSPATVSSMIEFRKFCVDYVSHHLHDDNEPNENQNLVRFVKLIAHSDQLFARARAVLPELQIPGCQTSPHASPKLQRLLQATQDLFGLADKEWEPLPEEPVWRKHLEQQENKKKTSSDRAQDHPAGFPPASTQSAGLRADVPEFKPSNAMGGRPVVYSPTSGTRLLRLSDSYEPQAAPASASSSRLAADFESLSVQKTRRSLADRPRAQSSGKSNIAKFLHPAASQFYGSPHAYAEAPRYRYPNNPGSGIESFENVRGRGRTRHSHKHKGPWNAANYTQADQSYAPSRIPRHDRRYHNSPAAHPNPVAFIPPNGSPHDPSLPTRFSAYDPPTSNNPNTFLPPQPPYPAPSPSPSPFNPSFIPSLDYPPPSLPIQIPDPNSLPPFQLWQALYATESTIHAHLAHSGLPLTQWHHGTLAYLQEMRIGAAASQIPPRARRSKAAWLEVLMREYEDVWRVKMGERRRTPSVVARKRDYEMALQREIEAVQQTEGGSG